MIFHKIPQLCLNLKRFKKGSRVHEITPGIYAEEYEQQDGEAPQRRTSVTEERQRYADNRRKTENHAHVYEHMEQENAGDAIAVDAPEGEGLALGKIHQPQNEQQEKIGRAHV